MDKTSPDRSNSSRFPYPRRTHRGVHPGPFRGDLRHGSSCLSLEPISSTFLIGLPAQSLKLEIGGQVVFKEARVFNIHGRRMFRTWARMESLLASGVIDVTSAITHVLSMDRWQEDIEVASSGAACKGSPGTVTPSP